MVYLVRHAHSAYSPDEMRELSPSGHAAAEHVADLLEGRAVSRIVSSPDPERSRPFNPLRTASASQSRSSPIFVNVSCAPRSSPTFTARSSECGATSISAIPAPSRASRRRIGCGMRSSESSRARKGRHVVVASHGNALALFLRTLDATVDFAFWVRMTTPDVYVVDVGSARPWTFRRIWTTT